MKIWIQIEEEMLEDVKAVLEGGKDVKPEKAGKKTPEKKQPDKTKPSKEAEPDDYESMKAADLYKLCCERGISSQCKKRDKASLIALLKANDEGGSAAGEEDDWGDDETPDDPYAGKTAKELYKLCQDRGITVKPKQAPEVYAKKLRDADEAAEDAETTPEEDDDDWEI